MKHRKIIKDAVASADERIETIKAVKGEAYANVVAFCISLYSGFGVMSNIMSDTDANESLVEAHSKLMAALMKHLVDQYSNAVDIDDEDEIFEAVNDAIRIADDTVHRLNTTGAH